MKAYRIYDDYIDDYSDEPHCDVVGYADTIATANQMIIGWAMDREIQTEYKMFKEPSAWGYEMKGKRFAELYVEEIDIQE